MSEEPIIIRHSQATGAKKVSEQELGQENFSDIDEKN
jgi:hypothetical protein